MDLLMLLLACHALPNVVELHAKAHEAGALSRQGLAPGMLPMPMSCWYGCASWRWPAAACSVHAACWATRRPTCCDQAFAISTRLGCAARPHKLSAQWVTPAEVPFPTSPFAGGVAGPKTADTANACMFAAAHQTPTQAQRCRASLCGRCGRPRRLTWPRRACCGAADQGSSHDLQPLLLRR
jgi:hypothetical protein